MDVNSIEAICKQKLRLDSDAVLDPDNKQALAAAVTQLQRSQEEAARYGTSFKLNVWGHGHAYGTLM